MNYVLFLINFIMFGTTINAIIFLYDPISYLLFTEYSTENSKAMNG